MIKGSVNSNEARIRLKVSGAGRPVRLVDAVIDTGYTASLTLPPALIAALDLQWLRVERGMPADGSECLIDVYEANVVWDRRTRRILVSELDTDPLVGMTLLSGYELKIQVRSGGNVTIRRLR